MFALLQLIIYIAIIAVSALFGAIFSATGGGSNAAGSVFAIVLMVLWAIVALGLFIPALAVTVRRLHDRDMTGWFLFISLVPFGSLVLLVFMCLEGTRGPNRYGPDPKAPGHRDIFA